MSRALILFLTILPWPGQFMFGQFSGLATTDDGTQLYFSSSLQLSGIKNENSYSKIFRYDGAEPVDVREVPHRSGTRGDFHVAAEVNRVVNGATTGVVTNFYNLSNPYVSGDGSVTGYVGTADCSGMICEFDAGVSQTTLQSAVVSTIPHACQVNRNAEFALCRTSVDGGGFVGVSMVDLTTGQTAPLGSTTCSNQPHSITSDGRVVFTNLGRVSLVTLSSSQILNLNAGGQCPIVSDDGSRIAMAAGLSLIAYDVATGVQSTIFTTPAGGSVLSITNDGSLILFVSYTGTIGQAAIIGTDGTRFLQLTDEPTGVSRAELSGDGSTAFVVTNDGKLLRIDTTNGSSSLLTSAAQACPFGGCFIRR